MQYMHLMYTVPTSNTEQAVWSNDDVNVSHSFGQII